jgi:TonB family protein
MRLSFITVLLIVASFSFAQPKIINVSFLKNNGTYVAVRDSADYFRLVSEPDSGSNLYSVIEYYKDGKRKLIGKSSKIDPPVYEGQQLSFYKSGVKESLTNFKNGQAVGIEYEFYPNGKVYRVTEYPDNNERYNDLSNNYLIKANYDSLGNPLVENGKGYYKGYTEGFKEVSEEGSVKNGKRDSLWKGISKTMKLTYTENYKDGQLISGSSISEDGKVTVYGKTRGVPPQFKGGLEAFYRYLGNSIQYPDDARATNVQGKVVLSFIVEKDGKVTNVVVKKSVSPTIDAEALRVLNDSPRWIPGTLFGRNMRVTYSVPVSFTLQE